MRLIIEASGERDAELHLLRFGERAADMSPALRDVATKLREQFGARFDAEGPGWAPLKPATLAAKAREGHSSKILQATGAGRASLAEEGGDNVEVVTRSTLVFGSSVRYMKFHDTGTSRMAQRKIVDFSFDDRREHTRIIQRYLVEGIAVAL